MTVLHKAITKKTKLQNISKKIIDIRERMEIIELKNLITEINKNKHKSCWICSKVKWRQEGTLNKLKTLIEFTKSEEK